MHEEENHNLEDGQPIDKAGRYTVPVNVRKVAKSYERSELWKWKRNKDITFVLTRAFGVKYQSDILEHVSSFVYATSLAAKARDTEKRDAHYCCECKGWYIGCCICLNF